MEPSKPTTLIQPTEGSVTAKASPNVEKSRPALRKFFGLIERGFSLQERKDAPSDLLRRGHRTERDKGLERSLSRSLVCAGVLFIAYTLLVILINFKPGHPYLIAMIASYTNVLNIVSTILAIVVTIPLSFALTLFIVVFIRESEIAREQQRMKGLAQILGDRCWKNDSVLIVLPAFWTKNSDVAPQIEASDLDCGEINWKVFESEHANLSTQHLLPNNNVLVMQDVEAGLYLISALTERGFPAPRITFDSELLNPTQCGGPCTTTNTTNENSVEGRSNISRTDKPNHLDKIAERFKDKEGVIVCIGLCSNTVTGTVLAQGGIRQSLGCTVEIVTACVKKEKEQDESKRSRRLAAGINVKMCKYWNYSYELMGGSSEDVRKRVRDKVGVEIDERATSGKCAAEHTLLVVYRVKNIQYVLIGGNTAHGTKCLAEALSKDDFITEVLQQVSSWEDRTPVSDNTSSSSGSIAPKIAMVITFWPADQKRRPTFQTVAVSIDP